MGTEQLSPLQDAVRVIKETQAKLAAYERRSRSPLRSSVWAAGFPAGRSAAFWRLLPNGEDAVREVPADRWNIDDYYDPDPAALERCVRAGRVLERGGRLRRRLLRNLAARSGAGRSAAPAALGSRVGSAEEAGLSAGSVARTRTGVYVGVIGNDYALLQSRDVHDLDIFSGTGSSHAILANRLSYVLDLNGPSITLDTACSSSLVTIHLACQSLRRRETDLALAGGVNLMLSPEMTITLTKAYMMAPDGRVQDLRRIGQRVRTRRGLRPGGAQAAERCAGRR